MHRLFCFLGLHRWISLEIGHTWVLQECRWCPAGRRGRWFSSPGVEHYFRFWDWFEAWWDVRDWHLQHPEEPWLHDRKGRVP